MEQRYIYKRSTRPCVTNLKKKLKMTRHQLDEKKTPPGNHTCLFLECIYFVHVRYFFSSSRDERERGVYSFLRQFESVIEVLFKFP